MSEITSWGPSRIFKYEECPARAKYDISDKLCPLCFKGKLGGGFGTPIFCDACDGEQTMPAPLARGIKLDEELEAHIQGKGDIPVEIRNTAVKNIIKAMKRWFGLGKVQIQPQIVLDKRWRPVSKFTKDAWFRGKLDILAMKLDCVAEVIDWKSGGIDRNSGGIKANANYQAQLEIYAMSTLAAFPDVNVVTSKLVFLDTGPKFDPVMLGVPVDRASLPKLRTKWEKRVFPMLTDRVFAPRPGYYCGWCPYSKAKGGPCRF